MELDYEELMVKAETKYDKLIKNKTWGKKDTREEQLLALQTQIKQLQKHHKPGGGSGNGKDNGNGKGPRNGKARCYPDWQYEKPKNGVKHMQKKIKGKTVDYWWCEVLEMWARHKPEECKAKSKTNNKGDNNTTGNTGTSGNNNNTHPNGNPRLQAQQTTLYALDDDSSDSDE